MFLSAAGLLAATVAVSFVAAYGALWLFSRRALAQGRTRQESIFVRDATTALLFEDGTLINATRTAMTLMNHAPVAETDLERFLRHVEGQYPKVRACIDNIAGNDVEILISNDGAERLFVEWCDGKIRIVIRGADEAAPHPEYDRYGLRALEAEIETLRGTAAAAPFLLWRQSDDGTVTWANAAYLELARSFAPDAPVGVWPPARLFVMPSMPVSDNRTASRRVSTRIPGEPLPRWFECFRTTVGQETLYMAVSADNVVKAEAALREFVQTLTKTFAQLKIGLAIFDKQRRLAIFNPALVELTGLSAEYLTTRPHLMTLLDRLREQRMIPEPRDYRSWRQKLTDLETEALNGTYEETWPLPSGKTYRVNGRPHPDGALAFLMEDISAEISLTRRFRSEIETNQAVLDALDEAVAVFSPGGTLTLANRMLTLLFGTEPETGATALSINDATRDWSLRCAPSPVWGDLREFVGTMGERAEWTAELRLLDGRALGARFRPLPGGVTLVSFALIEASGLLLPGLSNKDERVTAGTIPA